MVVAAALLWYMAFLVRRLALWCRAAHTGLAQQMVLVAVRLRWMALLVCPLASEV